MRTLIPDSTLMVLPGVMLLSPQGYRIPQNPMSRQRSRYNPVDHRHNEHQGRDRSSTKTKMTYSHRKRKITLRHPRSRCLRDASNHCKNFRRTFRHAEPRKKKVKPLTSIARNRSHPNSGSPRRPPPLHGHRRASIGPSARSRRNSSHYPQHRNFMKS